MEERKMGKRRKNIHSAWLTKGIEQNERVDERKTQRKYKRMVNWRISRKTKEKVQREKNEKWIKEKAWGNRTKESFELKRLQHYFHDQRQKIRSIVYKSKEKGKDRTKEREKNNKYK